MGQKEPSVTWFLVSAILRKEDRKASWQGGRWIAWAFGLAGTVSC